MTEQQTKINLYQNNIKKLEEMKEMYKSLYDLNGGFYTDMMEEINGQINHCKECINNLKKLKP